METILPLSKSPSFFLDERACFQDLFDCLSEKKISWDHFLQKVQDPMIISRLTSPVLDRTLLHLAVLDGRLDVVEVLGKDPSLRLKRDVYGLNPVEWAQFLGQKQTLSFLHDGSQEGFFESIAHLEDFTYLSHLVFENKEELEQILAYSVKAKEEDRIPGEKIWMGIYFEKEIRKGMHPPISIKENVGGGHSVFADRKIPPCTFIGEYTGMVREKLKGRKCLPYLVWESKKSFVIDAEKHGNFTRFIKQSKKPNLSFQSVYCRGIPRMILIALEEISEGQELLVDYDF